MATERSRARRINQYPRSEQGRRRLGNENSAKTRLPAAVLRGLYRPSQTPTFQVDTSEFADVLLLDEGQVPCLGEGEPFAHNLGEEVNSRERAQKMPDWYPVAEGESISLKPAEQPQIAEPPPADPPPLPKPAPKVTEPPKPLKIVLDPKAVVRNLPKNLEMLAISAPAAPQLTEEMFEERYSAIDVEMEKKLKVQEEEDEAIPEWAQPEKPKTPVKRTEAPVSSELKTRKFSVQLLQSQVMKGDPFAKLILDSGKTDLQGYVHIAPYSLPLEKVWFYKDPQMQVQGPFTTIEMYSWNLMGYFSMQLLVAWRTPSDFRTLQQLASESTRRQEERVESPVVAGLFAQSWNDVPVQKPQNAKMLHEVETAASSTKWGPAYTEHFPAFSASDPSAALKSMLGIKTEAKPTSAWGVPVTKPVTKSLVEIQREQREGKRPK